MFTIRCTQKLLKHLHAKGVTSDDSPTTVLGDWYGNLLYTKHQRLVICVSERSLLPVFVEAKEVATFTDRLRQAVQSVIERIGVERAFIDRELQEMSQVTLGVTASRPVLGSLNDLAVLSRESIKERAQISLVDLAMEIAQTPCSLIRYETPKSMTLALLRSRAGDH